MQHLKDKTTLQSGKYIIERILGQGGFGNTYVGFNTEFEETVAIKEFFMRGVTERNETTSFVSVSNSDNEAQFLEQRDKFKKEARRLRKLKSEHIVKVHDLFEENGTVYYVMDFIDGESLAERIKRTGKSMTEGEVLTILPQILDALTEVHNNEIWHLDLKPGNIMMDSRGNTYLIDFGASKQMHANGSMTTSTALCYTPGYAPNEQISQMYERFGPWTDIYALGATVYNLLTGHKPPMGVDIEEDEMGAFSFPESVSENMKQLVLWMMQPQRRNRPQNAEQIREKIGALTFENVTPDAKEENEDERTVVIEEKVDNQATVKAKDSDDEDDERTILYTTRKLDEPQRTTSHFDSLPQRTIKVGDFIFEDGTYSDKRLEKKTLGVLFSKYGGAHGLIVSMENNVDDLYINGKLLKWHQASIGEWVEIIQNLEHCKVSFGNGEYRYYPNQADDDLLSFLRTHERYVTRKSISGVEYIVDLKGCSMLKAEEEMNLPYAYITEF